MGSAIREAYSEQYVRYTLEMDGEFYIVDECASQGVFGDGGTVFCAGDC